MNNKRRKKIKQQIKALEGIYQRLEDLGVELEGCVESIELLLDEEQDYRNNIPENLENSQSTLNSDDVLEGLDTAMQSMQDVIDGIDLIDSDFLEVLEALRNVTK